MNNVLTIILIILNSMLIIGAIVSFIRKIKQPTSIYYTSDTIYDAQQNYMDIVNKFIRREFLFELKKWISTSSKNINVSESNPRFYIELTDPDTLQEKLSKITAVIISKMSPDITKAFYRVYSKNFSYYDDSVFTEGEQTIQKSEGDSLYIYVARTLASYIDRVVTEMTLMVNEFKDSTKIEVIEKYLLEINTEIYDMNNICIIRDRAQDDKGV